MSEEPKSFKIIGAAMAVHRELKNGFLEPVYQDALELEFRMQGIPFERESEINIFYKGIKLNKTYRADFICFGDIVVELKAVKAIDNNHICQTLNYLKATHLKKAVLLNFGEESLKFKTLIL